MCTGDFRDKKPRGGRRSRSRSAGRSRRDRSRSRNRSRSRKRSRSRRRSRSKDKRRNDRSRYGIKETKQIPVLTDTNYAGWSVPVLLWIRMFLGLLDPDPLVKRTRSGSGSGSFYRQAKIVRKTLIGYCFLTSFWLFIFEKWCKCTFKKLTSWM